jgi:hypothetical protein
MIVYFGIFTMDAGVGTNTVWNPNTIFFLNFSSSSGFSQNNTYKLLGPTYVAKDFQCSLPSTSEHWNKIEQSYAFNTPNVSLNFDISNN